MQELKATVEQLGPNLVGLPGYTSYWHGGPKGYSGIRCTAAWTRSRIPPEFSVPSIDVEHRAIEVRLPNRVVITKFYVPNGGKDYAAKLRFLEALRAHVDREHAAGARLLLCGDMNVTRSDIDVYPGQRKPDAIGQRPDERALFEQVLGSDLVDVARHLEPDNDQLFTWWAPWRGLRQKNHGWRLDYVLASRERGLEATGSQVLAEVGTSDYAPVVVTLSE